MSGKQRHPAPVDRFDDDSLVESCLSRAVAAALLQHKRAGNPIAIWLDGRVVMIAPEDIPDPPAWPSVSGIS